MILSQLTPEEKTIYVGLLTEVQKDELVGQLFDEDSYFNPIQDNSDNWIISIEEIENNVNRNFMWIKDLEMIIYIPKETTNLF
tara:strand:- start:931 stop:1179 length:249 start_codon:yes stop_codon:yes gene_type:complete